MTRPNGEPIPVEVQETGIAAWNLALSLIKNVLVILTCLLFWYLVWRGYVALAALQDALRDVADTFGTVGP